MSLKQATIVIPVFNEEKSISVISKEIVTPDFLSRYEIIFVDDGSTDGSFVALEQISRQHEDVILLRHENNVGYGASLKTGILRASTDIIIITDADSSYPNDRIPELHRIFFKGRYDMVVGARTKPGAAIPLIRRPPKWLINTIATYLVRSHIPDLNSGLRVFRKDVVLDYFNIICDGFSFTTTLTLIMLCNSRYNVKFEPIDYFKRSGKSKIKPIKDTFNFLLLVITTVLYFDPLRILLPPSLIMLFIGGGMAVFQAVFYQNIGTAALLLLNAGFTVFSITLLADLIVKSRSVVRLHDRD